MSQISEKDWEKIFLIRDKFIEKVQGYPPYPRQQKFGNKLLRAVFGNTGETIKGEWSRQSGKTSGITGDVGFLIHFYFPICEKFKIPTTPHFNVGFFAPLLEQAETGFNKLRDFLRACKEKGFGGSFETFRGNRIIVKEKGQPPISVYCMTASPTSHQESKTLNLIIFDESQDLVDKVVDKAIAPMGAMTNAVEVWIGVAGYQKCRFLEHRDKLPEENNFIFDYKSVLEEMEMMYAKTGNPIYLNYQKHIDKKEREIGLDSDEFKTQYMLRWILERGQFITYDQLMKCEAEYEIRDDYGKWEVQYAGIDWGKAGDSTILTIIDENCKLIAWYEWQGDDYSSQIEDIYYLLKNKYRGLRRVHCDATGNQDMGVDLLRRRCRDINVMITGVKFTSQSKDEMFKNLSRLMSDKIVGGNIVQEAVFKFPKDWEGVHKEKFIKQMTDLQKEIKGEMWKCQHPDGPSYHDDFCDSVALACLAFLPRKAATKHYKPMIG